MGWFKKKTPEEQEAYNTAFEEEQQRIADEKRVNLIEKAKREGRLKAQPTSLKLKKKGTSLLNTGIKMAKKAKQLREQYPVRLNQKKIEQDFFHNKKTK